MRSISTLPKILILTLSLSGVALLSSCAPVVLVGGAGLGAAAINDRRDTATLLEDSGIEFRATDEIYGDKTLSKNVQVKVHCYNGVVLLVGTAPSEAMRKKVEEMVFTIKPVRKVYNEIRVGERLDLESRNKDSWTTAKVKKQLFEEFGLVTHTLVVTSHEMVYLMGLVNADEEAKALQAASQLKGVKDVVPLYERYDVIETDSRRFAKAAPIKKTPAVKAAERDRQEQLEDQDTQLLPYDLPPAAIVPKE
ncbi:MAG: BON domain-containing protein [Gammaproteobacteria bacterium]|nr:BON domain-containing protein [Gammaproteobacteria bacterium]